MTIPFLTGIFGSIVLVAGAALPENKKATHPMQSAKNWCFAIGGLIMLIYSILAYLEGGSVFFILFEVLIVIATVLMILDADDKVDIPVISISGIALVVLSLYWFEDYSTIIFIFGLTAVGLGYALKINTIRRDLALTVGSALIALFSYFAGDWIFFWLNVFFSLFSGYYLLRKLVKK